MRLFFIAALCLSAMGQNTPSEPKGLPARASAEEYQARAQAGKFTIGADFVEHSVPTPDAIYSNEDYVVVEVGVFGPAGEHLTLSRDDFSLRINDKKAPLPASPFELMSHSLKDPNWSPPNVEKEKSKTGLNTGQKDDGQAPLSVIHMPIELQLAMQKRVKNCVLLGGDRTLPQAGLLFFEFRGKSKNIRSIELLYSGPAGKATLEFPL